MPLLFVKPVHALARDGECPFVRFGLSLDMLGEATEDIDGGQLGGSHR